MNSPVEPKVAQNSPYMFQVEEGKTYSWCTCGFSKAQPLCDGAHKESGTGLRSFKYLATETKMVAFCGCKKTANQPFCDGSHSR